MFSCIYCFFLIWNLFLFTEHLYTNVSPLQKVVLFQIIKSNLILSSVYAFFNLIFFGGGGYIIEEHSD